MPETTSDIYNSTERREDDIGTAGEVARVKSKPEASAMKAASDYEFWSRVS